jgi:hypothetical protein
MEKSSACLPSEGKSNNLSHVPTLGHVKEPSSCGSLRAAGKIRIFSFLPSLIEVSRAACCGVPLEMKEGTIAIWGTKGLSTRPRCVTLMTTHTGYPLHSPLPLPCVTVCRHISTGLYVFWVRVCSLRYSACKAQAPYYIICGLPGCRIFCFHSIS